MAQGTDLRILACFRDKNSHTFADICKEAGYPTDLGGYYLRALVHKGHLNKTDRGTYTITPTGKQKLALYFGKQFLALRPRVTVLLVVESPRGYATLERKVQPFLGVTEWPAGSTEAGEPLLEAAQRIAKERLGTRLPLAFKGFFRRIDMYEDTVFDDKLFAVHAGRLPEEYTAQSGATGSITMRSQQQLLALLRPGRALLDIYEFAHAEDMSYREQTYMLTRSDLFGDNDATE